MCAEKRESLYRPLEVKGDGDDATGPSKSRDQNVAGMPLQALPSKVPHIMQVESKRMRIL
jgi:hypothetical protein